MKRQAWWGSSLHGDFSLLLHPLWSVRASWQRGRAAPMIPGTIQVPPLAGQRLHFQFLGKLASTTAEITARPNFSQYFSP